MPKVANYRANSVIYFQGDAGQRQYLHPPIAARSCLNYTDIETGKDVHEIIQTGEFFGVKSALGKYPREENAVVLSDAQVLVFTVPEFEQSSPRPTPASSSRCSRSSRTSSGGSTSRSRTCWRSRSAASPEIGPVPHRRVLPARTGMYSQAKYVFSRYLTYYPAGKLADAGQPLPRGRRRAALLKLRRRQGPRPAWRRLRPRPAPAAGAPPGSTEARRPRRSPRPARPRPRGRPGPLGRRQGVLQRRQPLQPRRSTRKPSGSFKRIVEANEDPEYVAKAAFDMGRCLFMPRPVRRSPSSTSPSIVQTYPKHPDLADILYYLGQSYDKKGDNERAKGFFKKILTMETDEDDSTLASRPRRPCARSEEA
ncbi:MAG: hypothetical protein MZV70_22140 [Desulfobacterales bacterium]|nr:hypothetical protein [Desulfobacterales bacterium]